jgi:hypothetical protein
MILTRLPNFKNSISSGLENQNFCVVYWKCLQFQHRLLAARSASLKLKESALTFGHNQLFEDLSQPESSKLFLLAQISSVEKEGRI